jgi:hypothetical protein
MDKIKAILNEYMPKGCPFKNYTLYDLLTDMIYSYSWKIKGKITITEFIKLLQDEGNIYMITYGNDILKLIEEV